MVQPDISVGCDPKKLDERGCRGAPGLIIEVLSPSTAWHDRTRKAALSEKHGVREYWIVSPEERTVTVRLLGKVGRYGPLRIVGATRETVAATVLRGVSLDLRGLFEA